MPADDDVDDVVRAVAPFNRAISFRSAETGVEDKSICNGCKGRGT